MVSIEECEETGLGPRGAFDASKSEVIASAFDVAEVPQELLRWSSHYAGPVKYGTHLQPQRRPLPDRRELRRLEVREAERGEVAVLPRERREAVDDDGELLEEKRERFADEDQVGVA